MRSNPENRRERKNTVAPAAQAIAAGSTVSRNGTLFSRGPDVGIFRFDAKAPIACPQASQWQELDAPGTYHDDNSGYQRQCMPRLRELHHSDQTCGLSAVGDHVTQKTQGGTFTRDHDGEDASGLRDETIPTSSTTAGPARKRDGKMKLAHIEKRLRALALPVLSPQWPGPGDDRLQPRPPSPTAAPRARGHGMPGDTMRDTALRACAAQQ
jgi:hypothetical protein